MRASSRLRAPWERPSWDAARGRSSASTHREVRCGRKSWRSNRCQDDPASRQGHGEAEDGPSRTPASPSTLSNPEGTRYCLAGPLIPSGVERHESREPQRRRIMAGCHGGGRAEAPASGAEDAARDRAAPRRPSAAPAGSSDLRDLPPKLQDIRRLSHDAGGDLGRMCRLCCSSRAAPAAYAFPTSPAPDAAEGHPGCGRCRRPRRRPEIGRRTVARMVSCDGPSRPRARTRGGAAGASFPVWSRASSTEAGVGLPA